ncbi:MAG: rhomboid family intramembrane serine protease [Candidatus Eremiobacteraeota bacterium]|nr:rhomboid family intramembrane serine protease [Candidatus Eremiobacteraeota bacterium]
MTLRRAGATKALIALNVIVFVWEVLSGTNFGSAPSLLAHGALYGPLVRQGEWWRILSGAFEHAGLLHIAFNMFALYQLGMFVEGVLGARRMLAIYAISLFASGYAVVVFSPAAVTVGASGAIFGLFGALLAIGVRLGKRGRGLIAQTIPILLINLVFTFAVPFISKSGHLGGLLAGFCAGLLVFMTRPPARPLVGVVDAATGEAADAELLPPEGRRGA